MIWVQTQKKNKLGAPLGRATHAKHLGHPYQGRPACGWTFVMDMLLLSEMKRENWTSREESELKWRVWMEVKCSLPIFSLSTLYDHIGVFLNHIFKINLILYITFNHVSKKNIIFNQCNKCDNKLFLPSRFSCHIYLCIGQIN